MKTQLAHAEPRPAPSHRPALVVLCLAMLLSSLGTSIATVGLPALAAAFEAPIGHVQWVILAYLLAVTVSIISVGRLGDVTGRRRVLLVGVAMFTVASLLCAVAPWLWFLVAARALQGLGAAMMMALSTALVADALPRTRTGSAMGLLGTTSAIGTALGPSLGGLLIAGFGWRMLFLVTVPLGVLTWGLAMRHLPSLGKEERTRRASVDPLGTFLLAISLAAYALAVTSGRGSLGMLNVGLLIAAAIGAALFVHVEASVVAPLVPLGLFRRPRLGAGFATSAIAATVVMATLVIGPFHLADALALHPARIGLVMSIGPIVSALCGVPAGRVVDRFGVGRASMAGLTGMLAGAVLLSTLPMRLGVPGYAVPLGVLTAGYALFQAANNTAIMRDVGEAQRGLVAGVLNLSRNLGLITGASLMGAVFAFGTSMAPTAATRSEAAGTGTHASFAVAAALLIVALLMVIRGEARAPQLAPAREG